MTYTVEQHIAVKRVGAIAASPDGTWLAVSVDRLDRDGAKYVSDLTQIISRCRQQAQNNLKFYNYSLKDVEQAATETLPWQS